MTPSPLTLVIWAALLLVLLDFFSSFSLHPSKFIALSQWNKSQTLELDPNVYCKLVVEFEKVSVVCQGRELETHGNKSCLSNLLDLIR